MAATFAKARKEPRSFSGHSRRAGLLLGKYTVFNVQQADGISLQSLFGQPPPEWATHGEAERIVRGSGVLVQHVPDDRAYYRIDEDQVVLPEAVPLPQAEQLLPDSAALRPGLDRPRSAP